MHEVQGGGKRGKSGLGRKSGRGRDLRSRATVAVTGRAKPSPSEADDEDGDDEDDFGVCGSAITGPDGGEVFNSRTTISFRVL